MPPALRVIPTDFARYYSDGSGRDSYIHFNNGGLTTLPHRFDHNLRGETHNPNQVILLPSYGATASTARNSMHVSLAHSAQAAAARADPKLRAIRQHQRTVANYLHRAGSRQGMVPTLAPHYLPQTSRGSTARNFALNSSQELPAWNPAQSGTTSGSATSRAGTAAGGRLTNGAQTARAALRTPVPYATTSWVGSASVVSTQPYAEPPVSAIYIRDTFPRSLHTSVASANASGNNASNNATANTGTFIPHPPPTNFSATIPLGQCSPASATMQQQQQQQQAQAQERDQQQEFAAAATLQQQQQQQQPQQSTQRSFARSFGGSVGGEAKFIPTSPRSFVVTLPKNSAYLDGANTYRPRADYNSYAPAGFSMRDKLASKGIHDGQVPLLG